MGKLNFPSSNRATIGAGDPVPFARRRVFLGQSDVMAKLFRDANLTETIANPMTADEGGYFSACYLIEGEYSVKVEDRHGTEVEVSNSIVVTADQPASGGDSAANTFDTVASLLADEGLGYTGEQPVGPGDRIGVTEHELSYSVATSSATDAHLATAGGVKLYVMPRQTGFDVRAFGADPTGNVDSASAIQLAIDTASLDNIGSVWLVGEFLCNERLVLKRGVSLRGNWHHSTAANNWISRLRFVNDAASAKPACLVVDRSLATDIEFLEFEGLQITASDENGGWDHCILNKEVHWHRLSRCYFSGHFNAAVIWWGAVLYPQITDCVFSINSATVMIDGREANHDITYYGVNWGLIERNSFFGPMGIFVGTGLITFRGNNIENTNVQNGSKLFEASGPSSSRFVLENNYVEWTTAQTGTGANLKFWYAEDGSGAVTIRDNYISLGSNYSGTMIADANFLSYDVEVSNNGIFRVEAVVGQPSGSGTVRMAQNQYFGTATLRPAQIYKGGNRPYQTTGGGNANYGHFQFEDEVDTVLSQRVIRTLWQEANGSSPTLYLKRGKNIQVGSSNATIDRIVDAGLYPGAEVTVLSKSGATISDSATTGVHAAWLSESGSGYTTATVTINGNGSGATATATINDGAIQHVTITNPGSGYSWAALTINGDGTGASGACCVESPFKLAKGADVVLPAGRAINFVVDMNRQLAEVGDYSTRL